jgi:hypothetical protein
MIWQWVWEVVDSVLLASILRSLQSFCTALDGEHVCSKGCCLTRLHKILIFALRLTALS